MNIKIMTISSSYEKFYKDAIAEYTKRLSRYCKLSLLEFKTKDQLLQKISINDYKIQVFSDGINISSEDLSEKIKSLGLTGNSSLTMIIGIDDSLDVDETLSLSQMKMSIPLEVTVLLEQIYRAYRILNNQAYHK